MSRNRFLMLLAGGSAAGAAALLCWGVFNRGSAWMPLANNLRRVSVEDRVEQYGGRADARLRPAFERAGVAYPPGEVALLVFKDTRALEVYARDSNADDWRHVTSYGVCGASGKPGPKLAEGDRQVPEGIYGIELLNPASRFHLSLRLDYPNAFDRRMGAADGRVNLGSDIMIHGGAFSVGCLAMGDDVAEDLFILAARTGKENMRVVIAPTDFRQEQPRKIMYEPRWVSMLYANLSEELARFPRMA
jgi:hypothetical protein